MRKSLQMVMPWSWAVQQGKGEPESSLPDFSACWRHFLLEGGQPAANRCCGLKSDHTERRQVMEAPALHLLQGMRV